jgi:hypothetical protein
MAIKSSRYYNDPAIGQAFENLSALFAPPDSGDAANYALARERNQRSDIVAQLQQNPEYAGFDMQAILADLYDPTQSFRKVEMDDATARRGQDVSAATSRANNASDNQRALVEGMFGPLGQGEVRPALPDDLAAIFDLPPIAEAAGAAKPLSNTEVVGANRQRLIDSGQLTDDMLVNEIMGSVPVENVVDPVTGKPVIAARPDAVGKEPYFNKGAEAKPDNAVALLADGTTQVPAVQGPDNRWYNAQTGEVLPADIRIFKMPQTQGSMSDTGLSKPTNSYIERQLVDIAIAKDTAQALRKKIADSPASQGLVGWMRGTAQNVIQTGGEVGKFFGGQVAEVTNAIENGLADADLAGAFDPNIPAIEMLANLLAFQYAKTTTGERLSNEMLKASRRALGLDGLDANQANSLARLDQAIAQIDAQEKILRGVRKNGLDATAAPSPAPTDPTAMPSAEDVPDGVDPEDWKYLTEAERAEFLNGN